MEDGVIGSGEIAERRGIQFFGGEGDRGGGRGEPPELGAGSDALRVRVNDEREALEEQTGFGARERREEPRKGVMGRSGREMAQRSHLRLSD